MKIRQECEGCLEYYKDDPSPLFTEACHTTYSKLDDNVKCPCGGCLIKSMCGTSCVEYENFRRSLIQLQKLEFDGHGI